MRRRSPSEPASATSTLKRSPWCSPPDRPITLTSAATLRRASTPRPPQRPSAARSAVQQKPLYRQRPHSGRRERPRDKEAKVHCRDGIGGQRHASEHSEERPPKL